MKRGWPAVSATSDIPPRKQSVAVLQQLPIGQLCPNTWFSLTIGDSSVGKLTLGGRRGGSIAVGRQQLAKRGFYAST